MQLLGFEMKTPDVATIVRWILRLVLVAFLAWLVKGRQQQEEEEEEPEEDEDAWQKKRLAQARGPNPRPKANNSSYRTDRAQPRDPYSQRDVRQRRPAGNSESVDFDAVISKMSKPKTMWETKKAGEAPKVLKAEEPTTATETKPSGQVNKYPKSEDTGNSLLKKSMLHAHERPVTWITWNRDGNLLFTCGKDKKVCVWSFPDGECLGSYTGHNGAVWACSVTVDSSWLVTGAADQNVIVWEARTSKELARTELPGVCRFVEWASSGSTAGERFATIHNKFGSNPPAITLFGFDGVAIEQQFRIEGLPGPSTQVRWGRDDALLASAHESGELIFWRADTGAEVRRLQAHEAPLSKIDFSSDRLLVATASTDMKVKVWDLGEDGSDAKLLYEAETDRPLNAVALGPLTRADVRGPGGVRPGLCSVIVGGGQDIRDVAMSSTSSDQFGTLLFKVGDSNLQGDGQLKGHFGPIHSLAFTADGSATASGSEDGCVRLHMFSEAGAAK